LNRNGNATKESLIMVSPIRRILNSAANVKEDASLIVFGDAKAAEFHGAERDGKWDRGRRSYQLLIRSKISISCLPTS
jgi:hypothetical protein